MYKYLGQRIHFFNFLQECGENQVLLMEEISNKLIIWLERKGIKIDFLIWWNTFCLQFSYHFFKELMWFLY